MVDKVRTVPLSDNTVKDRIDKLVGDCQNQLHEKLRNVPFSIQLDETTVSDECMLIVYVQYIDGDDLKQDILMSTNLAKTTTGQDFFFIAMDSYLSSNNMPYEIDEAAALMGKNPRI